MDMGPTTCRPEAASVEGELAKASKEAET